ncbi:MAG: hypothetical protein ACU843_10565 [Gammaproteobacteria bacterium]
MKKFLIGLFCLFLATACNKQSGPPQYNYKKITVTSIYTDFKKDKETAMQKAEAELEAFTKSACRDTIAKHWSLVEVKNKGEMNCEETPEGHHCRKKNIELECRQVIVGFP